MDPISIIEDIVSAGLYVKRVADTITQNREECERLGNHLLEVLECIEKQLSAANIPQGAVDRLVKLLKAVQSLSTTLDALANQSRLKRILWKYDVARKIGTVYKGLSEALSLFQLDSSVDMKKWMEENERAKKIDAEQTRKSFEKVLHNDREILQALLVQRTEAEDGILSIQHKLDYLEDAMERVFLQKILNAMIRVSGSTTSASDDFLITPLDIIIHEHKKLGQGGFAAVYQGDWKGTTVAVKVIDNAVHERVFRKEISVWKNLRHPNILQFLGACYTGERGFAVCVYKENGDVLNYLQTNPDTNRIQLPYEASKGLSYLHGQRVIHGDLKANNILVDAHGRACLCDFGLAQVKAQTKSLASSQNVGTARWASPEQMSGSPLNEKTDIYSFGMTMYEVFTEEPPFAHVPNGVLYTIIVDRGERPHRPNNSDNLRRGLHDPFWLLIQKCWTHEPLSRPSAQSIMHQLKQLLPSGAAHDIYGREQGQVTEAPSGPPIEMGTLATSHSNSRDTNRRQGTYNDTMLRAAHSTSSVPSLFTRSASPVHRPSAPAPRPLVYPRQRAHSIPDIIIVPPSPSRSRSSSDSRTPLVETASVLSPLCPDGNTILPPSSPDVSAMTLTSPQSAPSPVMTATQELAGAHSSYSSFEKPSEDPVIKALAQSGMEYANSSPAAKVQPPNAKAHAPSLAMQRQVKKPKDYNRGRPRSGPP
ncbi:kinase-like protein [Neolentinus lepideus HHB14362 ss-1]|uniref:Kinase-like protein n=1 Tax=Neolentinus lepideus HHB14362 ss-1 TaxID=1314782 RepID=A0A165T4N3_9AGAM|nr:kinase-like protein [Neolentinus lepideus HHB14362 ss-1]